MITTLSVAVRVGGGGDHDADGPLRRAAAGGAEAQGVARARRLHRRFLPRLPQHHQRKRRATAAASRQQLSVLDVIAAHIVRLTVACVCWQGGIYFFQIIDYYSSGVSLMLIAFFEVAAVAWVYGQSPTHSHRVHSARMYCSHDVHNALITHAASFSAALVTFTVQHHWWCHVVVLLDFRC